MYFYEGKFYQFRHKWTAFGLKRILDAAETAILWPLKDSDCPQARLVAFKDFQADF